MIYVENHDDQASFAKYQCPYERIGGSNKHNVQRKISSGGNVRECVKNSRRSPWGALKTSTAS